MQRLEGKPIMRVDPFEKSQKILMRKIMSLIDQVYNRTDDQHLKAVVNSVFDTMSVVDTIAELRGLNDGHQPQWYCQIDN